MLFFFLLTVAQLFSVGSSLENDDYTCPDHLFTCANKECISLSAKCDGHTQCSDGSDEIGCPTHWPQPSTTTRNPEKTSPPDSKQSKTKKKSSPETDGEKKSQKKKSKGKKRQKRSFQQHTYTAPPDFEFPNEPYKCPKPLWQCWKEEQCILPTVVCDGKKDCKDGTDELECQGKSPADFTANLTKEEREAIEQIEESERRSEEARKRAKYVGNHYDIHPTDPTTAPPLHHCGRGLFKCKSGQCIPSNLRCDGQLDCGDSTDELDCHQFPPRPDSFRRKRRSVEEENAPFKCPDYLFTCRNTECVAMRRRCDGEPDCADGSDEEGCDPKARPSKGFLPEGSEPKGTHPRDSERADEF